MNPTPWLIDALPLAGLVFVMSITPGPNNVLVLDSGIRFGVGRTLPHLLGITIGFVLLALLTLAGVGSLIDTIPGFEVVLTVVCSACLLWIVWQLITSQPTLAGGTALVGRSKPWSFLAAAGFQFLNPKAWALAATCAGLAAQTAGSGYRQAFLLGAVGVVVNFPCVLIWAVLGTAARRWLESPRWFRMFNWSMAILLAFTLILMLKDVA
jgi:threonine/homoserine/homoserine lactone efflux protein